MPSLEDWFTIDARLWEGRTMQELAGHRRLGGYLEAVWVDSGREILLESIGDRRLRMDRQAVEGEDGSCWPCPLPSRTPPGPRPSGCVG